MNIRCPNCKFEGKGKRITKGYFAVELLLYFAFILPGIAYTLWRLTNKKDICPQCGFEYVIKTGTA